MGAHRRRTERRENRDAQATPETEVTPSSGAKATEGDHAAQRDDEAERQARAPLHPSCPFPPGFFLTELRAFVRDRCPDPSEGLPAVEIHLRDGVVLDVCHVIGLTESWVALSVDDRAIAGIPSMRTELVPYAMIVRVTVRTLPRGSDGVGFVSDVPAGTQEHSCGTQEHS
jgi:hypothetical protein